MPSLLIAGSGYLGQEVHRRAETARWQVTALSKSGDTGSIACDLGDGAAVKAFSLQHSDFSTVLLSASSGRGGPEAYRAVFLDGTRHLLESFPHAHLLFVSSTSVYGQLDGSLVTEESAAEPETETSQILLEAEAAVLAARGTVARLAGIYGPGRSVILKRFLEGAAVIEEEGARFLNQIHRDDAASALLHLASHPETTRGQIYNVTDSSPLHQGDCYHALAQIFDRPLPPKGPRPENRKRAWTHKRVSNVKLRETGWQPRYSSFIDAAEEVAATLGRSGQA